MKINLKTSEKEFIKYVDNYDLSNENIVRKKWHSFRVMEISKKIAESINLNEEEVKLATLIGLLHDIARFEQYSKYKTFHDSESIDHGDYAIKILNQDIRKYIQTDEYDEIIKKAIKNHNKYKIEEGLSKKEKLFAQIIRDADKLDILYESIDMILKGQESIIENSVITEEILGQFNNNKLIKLSKKIEDKNKIDRVVAIIAFIFDINFKYSFEIIKREDYINKILNKYSIKDEYTKNQILKIKQKANKYVEERIRD